MLPVQELGASHDRCRAQEGEAARQKSSTYPDGYPQTSQAATSPEDALARWNPIGSRTEIPGFEPPSSSALEDQTIGSSLLTDTDAAAAEVSLDESGISVRSSAASQLNQSLARLEMNALELKHHLDSIDQRIGRMEPLLESQSTAPVDVVVPHEPAAAPTATEQVAPPSLTEQPLASPILSSPPDSPVETLLPGSSDQPAFESAPEISTPLSDSAPLVDPAPEPRTGRPEARPTPIEFPRSAPEPISGIDMRSDAATRTEPDLPGPAPRRRPHLVVLTEETPVRRPPPARTAPTRSSLRRSAFALGGLLAVLAVIASVWLFRDSHPPAVYPGQDAAVLSGARQPPPAEFSADAAVAASSSHAKPGASSSAAEAAPITDPNAAAPGSPETAPDGKPSPAIGSSATAPAASGPTRLPRPGAGMPANLPEETVPHGAREVSVSSGVMAANLVYSTMPGYPRLANFMHVGGRVVLQVIISRNGTVENVRPIRGHYLLRKSAGDAVRTWRYRPYVVNGRPVEVATIVSVDFRR